MFTRTKLTVGKDMQASDLNHRITIAWIAFGRHKTQTWEYHLQTTSNPTENGNNNLEYIIKRQHIHEMDKREN